MAKPLFAIWKCRSSLPWLKSPRRSWHLGVALYYETENREAIRTAGPVVWLRANVDTIMERLAADSATASRRPNLTKAGGRAEVEELLAVRTPLYSECATLAVETDGKSVGEIASEIVAKLEAETVNSP